MVFLQAQHSMWEDVLVVALAQQPYALPVRQVREVLPRATLTTLPGCPAGVIGVLSLRGALLPVLDLGQRLGLPSAPATISQCIVVTDLVRSTVGLLVDTVVGLEGVGQIPEARAQDGPPGIIRQVTELAGRLVSILDPDAAVGDDLAAYLATIAPRQDAASLTAPVTPSCLGRVRD
jgi:purine-binding chemotaxis protein CheW